MFLLLRLRGSRWDIDVALDLVERCECVFIGTSLTHPSWHGHVSAISVAPEFRRTGVANRLMEYLEEEGSEGSTPQDLHGNLMKFQVRRII